MVSGFWITYVVPHCDDRGSKRVEEECIRKAKVFFFFFFSAK